MAILAAIICRQHGAVAMLLAAVYLKNSGNNTNAVARKNIPVCRNLYRVIYS